MATVDLVPTATTPPGLTEPRSAPPTTTVLTVPWRHLLPAAVVLSLTNTAWLIVMRGTAGPAIRTAAAPFGSWLRESAVLLPWYVAATLAAAVLVLRRRARSGRSHQVGVLPALLAIAGTGALAGILVLMASTTYDYVLERGQVVDMSAMRSNCGVDCVNFLQQSTGIVQLKAIGYGSLGMVVTDLLLLALLVAFRGGRLPLAGTAPAPAADRQRVGFLAVLLSATLIGSAVVHAAVIPEHLQEWPLAAEFFWMLVMAEAVAAVLVLRRDDTGRVMLGVAGMSLATVLLWTVSRTSGLPFGPEAWEPESIGVADIAATSLELASLGLALVLLHGRSRLDRTAGSSHGRALVIASVVAATAIGVAGSSLPVVGAYAPVAPAHHGGAEHAGHGG